MVSMVARTVFFTEYPQAFFALVRTHGRSLRGSCAALALLFFATAATVCGQSLVVTSGGSTVNQGTTISITTVPSMPNLVLSVNGGNSCDTVSYIVDVSYTDQAGNTTWAQYSAQNYAGDQPVTADWSGVLTGGSASVDGTSEGSTLGFFINGGNPPNSAVDAYASSGPWFVRNLIAWESRAWSLSPTGQYKQFDAFGYPLWGTPDGIGLMQLEPLYRISLDQDYWSWPTNVADGLNLINGKQSAAYNHWTTQINFAQMDGGPNPPSLYGTYCAFQYPQNGGDYYGDADWIHYYNSNYYTQWVRPSPPNPGYWNMDGYNHSSYVQHVCNAVPL